MDHPYLDKPPTDGNDGVVIIALNEGDAEDFRFANPSLSDTPWLTPSQYIRRGTRAPRKAYTTQEVKALDIYPQLKAIAEQTFTEQAHND